MICLPSEDSELVERFLRCELSKAERETIETHVLECGDCAAWLERLAILKAELLRRREEIEGEA